MLEILKFKVANWMVKRLEAHGEGVLFNFQDQKLCEISEALLLDGETPSVINSTVLQI